ncbi:MAG TPA: hypothetical protein VFQ22_07905 [Longimicrobiales bacterium]|nr:hypothetical protein [Longimicrobiales bacterium]
MELNRSRRRWTWEGYTRLPMSGSTRYEGHLSWTPLPGGPTLTVAVTEILS